MEKYIMALDQGTTSSRCVLYNRSGVPVSTAQKEYKQYFPAAGMVEHDAMEIWSGQLAVAGEAMAKINAVGEDIDSIGITNQWETTIVWDRETGKPICRAIVWQCRRTAGFCDSLKEAGYENMFHEKTGLLIDAYFSATKLKWILDNVDGARENARAGKLLFGTVDSWLIWKLSGGKVHVTDYSNASRTMMFNIHKLEWDDEILDMFDIPKCMLPEPKPSSMIYGYTDPKITGSIIPICGAAGDQQAALFGQTCFQQGHGKMTFGTGGFLLMNTGKEIVDSKNGLLSTIAWGTDDSTDYALEGSVFMSGATVQWLRDELGIISSARDTEKMATDAGDNGGVYLVPAFTGLGAPYWDPYARGAVFGLTRGSSKNHVARASLECQAYQTLDLLTAMAEDMGCGTKLLKVDGGGCRNDFMMQFLADITDIPVVRPTCIETTSLGAAYLAGLATGYWNDREEIKTNCGVDREFIPSMGAEERMKLIDNWHRAVECARAFSK